MAGKTRVIKRRMKAVVNIRRITNTMRMIATARFQKLFKQANSARPFSKKIAEVVAEVASSAASSGGVTQPLLVQPAPAIGKKLLLVVSSNRGLCGAYNANLLRAALAFLTEQGQDPIDLEVIGKKGLAYFRFARREVAAHHAEFGETPDYSQTERLAERYMQAFTDQRYDGIWVAYTAFHSMSRQMPEVLRLLPLEKPAPPAVSKVESGPSVLKWTADYEFSPGPEALLNELLPLTTKTRLFQCLNEAIVSEQLARMVAMQAATDAAGKMGKQLTRRFNRARQTAITTELSEIIGGAAALG